MSRDADFVLEYTIKIARNGDVTNDVVTHGNSFADIYRAFHAVKREVDRQIAERRNCPFNPIYEGPEMRDEDQIEAEIQAKGLTAPRLTPALIDATILAEQFHVFPGTTMTVCCLTLRNGFQVVGYSASASRRNFDPAIGEKIARSNAREQIWAFEGYLLRQRLFDPPTPSPAPE
jgi:hypothetical protein